ncbi:hypothetical protein BAUCODRAFT_119777 [Baudoinia panamericana UAMH 10762]|uniref:Uncharacterized protein n=1 Tax=Baudoinia panamericana (strain UAMH 10762) TaxID=717646 RepID=M2NM25_BAUPA|nr:uncharacterized protein BAUCODRAFT_119777 [Baudoinia panamericana UAMH 10762]EMD00226.1 hypothetical protein BAUCODRAFT_119777 [Baudoinia panamericana UAMH 10762]
MSAFGDCTNDDGVLRHCAGIAHLFDEKLQRYRDSDVNEPASTTSTSYLPQMVKGTMSICIAEVDLLQHSSASQSRQSSGSRRDSCPDAGLYLISKLSQCGLPAEKGQYSALLG